MRALSKPDCISFIFFPYPFHDKLSHLSHGREIVCGMLSADTRQSQVRQRTAEALMRSRYTAFVRKHGRHILASWHPRTRPHALNFDDHPVVWLGLIIHECREGGANDSTGTVEFTSSYLENGQLCHLTEKSRFEKKDSLWFYLPGASAGWSREKVERTNRCPAAREESSKNAAFRADRSQPSRRDWFDSRDDILCQIRSAV